MPAMTCFFSSFSFSSRHLIISVWVSIRQITEDNVMKKLIIQYITETLTIIRNAMATAS